MKKHADEPASDDPLYRAMKKLECTAQSMIFELPQVGSHVYASLGIDNRDAWKIGALVDHLFWLVSRARAGANKAFNDARADAERLRMDVERPGVLIVTETYHDDEEEVERVAEEKQEELRDESKT